MHRLQFYKYQGTGNDFVMIDNRKLQFNHSSTERISAICDRRFGVGADGLILIEDHPEYDFETVYFNSDGSQSLCGNGTRCAVMFARKLGIINTETTFQTIEGPLKAFVRDEVVHLGMPDVTGTARYGNDLFVNTGSPHYIRFVDDLNGINVVDEGRKIRNSSEFEAGGTNVNFVQRLDDRSIFVRTYERGVENETLSCGTGVTASALAFSLNFRHAGIAVPAQSQVFRELSPDELMQIDIRTKGGDLKVEYKSDGRGGFRNIYLIGPAVEVFEGSIRSD